MFRALLLSAALLVFAHSRLYYLEEKHIIQMGEIYWNNMMTDFKDSGLFIFYHHPQSITCKQFLPELESAATQLFYIKSSIQFAKIDCHDEAKICESMGVTSYPTVILYKGDKQYEYFGPRQAVQIKLWLEKLVEETFPICDHEENLFKRFNIAIVMNNAWVGNAVQAYKNLVDEAEIIQDHGDLWMKSLGGSGTIYSQGLEVVNFQDSDSASWIVDKVESMLYSKKIAIPNFNARAWKKLQESDNADFVLFFRTAGYSPLADATSAFMKVARENSNKDIQFSFVNSDDAFGETLIKWFGVSYSGSSVVAAISKKGGIIRKYKLGDSLSEENIRKFVDGFKDGNLKRYYMTAGTPIVDKKYVKHLTGSNFAQVTQDPNKSVFVLLYFPWNSAYSRLENHLRVLHSRLWRNPNIIIAKIDISENDAEGAEPSQYPALLLYPSGSNKKAITYDSDVSISGLQDFLIKHVPGLEVDLDL